MRWIVGIDLGEHAGGALQMAAWLRTHRRPELEQEFVGIYVLDEWTRGGARDHELAALTERARAALQAAFEPTGVASPFGALEIVLAPNAVEGLSHAAVRPDIDGLLVGRLAGRVERSLVRLGRVTRQLLRRLPAPVMVVPPDLPRTEVGKGPLLVATDLQPRSVNAARLARRLATELDRGLVVAHVDPAVQVVPSFVGEGTLVGLRTPRSTTAEVVQWIVTNDLGDAQPCLLDGVIVDALLGEASRVDAPLVVCGAEHISPAARLFGASVAGDLARLADRAVLVVPSV